ncbi:MAG TPA: hypothetical protein VK338_02470 [Candidatus Nitrosocosmicus sp.]|nr:hypothetical protein [Candidatus Nitrosocosmicus sp.]
MTQYQNRDIFHCRSCGTNFLEENEINRITITDALLLSHHARNIETNASRLCPKDHAPLKVLQGEAIPQFVQILQCTNCLGLVTSGKDLVAFKKAQHAKIAFFKNWNLPLPSLHSVLVYSFLIILGLTTLSMFGTLFTPRTTTTQASDVIRNISIQKNGDNAILYFTTPTSYKSELIFFNKNGSKELSRSLINNAPSTVHIKNMQASSITQDLTFKIMLTNGDQKIESELKQLRETRK